MRLSAPGISTSTVVMKDPIPARPHTYLPPLTSSKLGLESELLVGSEVQLTLGAATLDCSPCAV